MTSSLVAITLREQSQDGLISKPIPKVILKLTSNCAVGRNQRMDCPYFCTRSQQEWSLGVGVEDGSVSFELHLS